MIADPEIAINTLTVVHPGGTVNFVEVTDDDKVFTGYCTAVCITIYRRIKFSIYSNSTAEPDSQEPSPANGVCGTSAAAGVTVLQPSCLLHLLCALL